MTRHRERIILGIGLLTMVAFIIFALTPAPNFMGARLAVRSKLEPAGAIVVLGAGVMHGGLLQEESMRRVIRGIELYKQALAPLIVLSGPARADSPGLSEAEVRAKLAAAVGIPLQSIFKEETANTTQEESAHIADLLRRRHISRILLVTDSLHMRRARMVFERAGLEVLPGISADYTMSAVFPADRLQLTMRVMQETVALIYYRVAGYI